MPDTPDTPETPDFSPLSLPLIPLEDALVLPGMALSVDLASPEANAAVDEIGDLRADQGGSAKQGVRERMR